MVERESKNEILDLSGQIITFTGPEGAGKSYCAMKLTAETGMPYITTGSIVRDLAANDPGPLGNECRQLFEDHSYLSATSLLNILRDRFEKEDTKDGFVLDGGLRTLKETVEFQDMLNAAGRSLPLTVIHLKLFVSKSFERLVDGKNARRREDDTREGVSGRLGKYYYQLDERLAEIERQPNWDLISIVASESRSTVYNKVRQSLNSKVLSS